MILAAAFVSGLGINAHAQTLASSESVSLSLTADNVDRRPVNGYDGIIREGRAAHVMTLTGNVVIEINGMRVTADMARYYSATRLIELGEGGRSRIEIPGRITAFSVGHTSAAEDRKKRMEELKQRVKQ
jgi:hypothetical protein